MGLGFGGFGLRVGAGVGAGVAVGAAVGRAVGVCVGSGVGVDDDPAGEIVGTGVAAPFPLFAGVGM